MKTYIITMKVFNIQWQENNFRWKSPNEIEVSITLYSSQFPKDEYDMKDLIDDYLIDFCGDCDCVYEFGKDFDIQEESNTTYEDELMPDNSHYQGDWQPYRSNNR